MTKRVLLLSAAFLVSGCGVGSRWAAIRENRKGVEALKAEDAAAAGDHFIRGLAEQPFLSPFHHNLGLVLDIQKKPDESLNSYKNAERLAVDDDSRFLARFNLGEELGRAKKIDEALAWYQKALEIRPDSVETKTNIELLLKGGGGQGDGQDQQDQRNQSGKSDQKKDGKDQQKDQQQDGEGQDQKKDKQYRNTPKYQPRPFKGEMSEADVKKILGEIRQQEQRIRAEYNRKDAKERPRDKDW